MILFLIMQSQMKMKVSISTRVFDRNMFGVFVGFCNHRGMLIAIFLKTLIANYNQIKFSETDSDEDVNT